MSALSNLCLPMISAEKNLFLEQVYLSSTAKLKSSKLENRKRKNIETESGASHEPETMLVGEKPSAGTAVERLVTVKKRLPKKKCALLISYCGTGYSGLQINPQVASIELDLHKALAMAGAVSEDNQMNPAKNNFSRCARTDKGVHAGGNVVSLKMHLVDNVIEKINSFLPQQIRVWNYALVKNSFDSKNLCDSRIYEYLLPTYCLQPAPYHLYPNSGLLKPDNYIEIPKPVAPEAGHRDQSPLDDLTEEEKLALQEYRIDEETHSLLSSLLQEYKGSHNFHNFTIGKSFSDNSARRYMLSLSVSKPFLESNREWISIKIHGQSFMLHQIRKMVALVVLMIRTRTSKKLIAEAYGDIRINVPKAPALGLLLERPIFAEYNRTMEDKDGRDQIDFEPYRPEIEAFKKKWIYDAINRDEQADGHFGLWLKGIDRASTDVEWYLRGDGDICIADRPELLFQSLNKAENDCE